MTAGKGISAIVNNTTYTIGNENFIRESGCVISDKALEILDKLRTEGKASVLISASSEIIGIIALSDMIRPESADMVKSLNSMGTKAVLLTGDNKKQQSTSPKELASPKYVLIFFLNKKLKI